MQPLPNNPEHDPMQPPPYNPELNPNKSAGGFSNYGFNIPPSQNQFNPIAQQNNFYPPPQNQYNPPTINQGNQQTSYNAFTNQVVVAPTGIQRSRGYVDFTAAIVMSCLVIWFGGILFGLIAFILAMVGQSSAASGDETNARCLRTASYSLSIVGIVMVTVLIIVIISIASTSGFSTYSYRSYCSYSWC